MLFYKSKAFFFAIICILIQLGSFMNLREMNNKAKPSDIGKNDVKKIQVIEPKNVKYLKLLKRDIASKTEKTTTKTETELSTTESSLKTDEKSQEETTQEEKSQEETTQEEKSQEETTKEDEKSQNTTQEDEKSQNTTQEVGIIEEGNMDIGLPKIDIEFSSEINSDKCLIYTALGIVSVCILATISIGVVYVLKNKSVIN